MALYEHLPIARQDISAHNRWTRWRPHLKPSSKAEGGKVEKQEYWGLRGLAYRIKKNRKGIMLLNINAPSKAVTELERQIKINEDVLRYITVKVDAFDVSSSRTP